MSIVLKNWKCIRHFSAEEFRCPCCGRQEMDLAFVSRLDNVRERLGAPLAVLSGFRCPEHNRRIGGAEDSAHLRGLAADLGCAGSAIRLRLLEELRQEGFNRLGLGASFIHVDADPDLPGNVLWLY